MKDLRDAIEEILSDLEYYASTGMVVEEKEPFFFRINPDYAKDKSNQLLALFLKEYKEREEMLEVSESFLGALEMQQHHFNDGTKLLIETMINVQRQKLKGEK